MRLFLSFVILFLINCLGLADKPQSIDGLLPPLGARRFISGTIDWLHDKVVKPVVNYVKPLISIPAIVSVAAWDPEYCKFNFKLCLDKKSTAACQAEFTKCMGKPL